MKESKFSAFFNRLLHAKGSKRGAMAAGMIALVIVLVLVVNMALGALNTGALEIDISNKAIYEISDTSVQYAGSLDTDVDIILVAVEDEIDTRIKKFVTRYAAMSEHINWSVIDPITTPSVLDLYECEADTIVVRNAETGKFTTFPMKGTADGAMIVLNMDYNTYEYKEAYFDGEGLLTSSIEYVLTDVTNTLYCLTGHGETGLSDSLLNLIGKANIGVGEDVDLLMDGGIPENCDTLVIYGPTSDLADDELPMLKTYLSMGGNVILLLGDASFPNFNSFLESYGMRILDGDLGDTARCYSQFFNSYGYFCTSPVLSAESTVTARLAQDGSNALIMYPHACETLAETPKMMTYDTLLTTGDKGILYTPQYDADGNIVNDQDGNPMYDETIGTYKEAIMATIVLSNSLTNDTTASLTLFTIPNLINPQVTDSFTSMVNLDIFMNTLKKNLNNVSEFTIYAKSLETTYVTINTPQPLMIIYIAVLPLVCFVTGLLVWVRRRKR